MNARMKTLLAAGALFCALGASAGQAHAQQTYPQCSRPEVVANSPIWSRLCPQGANRVIVDQRGTNNGAATVQLGHGNLAQVIQRGTGNVSRTIQNGSNNNSSVRQIGSNNEANVTQNGNGNFARVIQVGDGHQTDVVQNGGERGVYIQTPAGSWSRELPNPLGQLRARVASGAERRYAGDLR